MGDKLPEYEPHEANDVATLREAGRMIANNRSGKHGLRTLYKALRIGEIQAQVRTPEAEGWIRIPKGFWFTTGREALDDLEDPYTITPSLILPFLAQQIAVAQQAIRERRVPDFLEVPELAAWFRASARGLPGQPDAAEFASATSELLVLLARYSTKNLVVFLRMADVLAYVGGRDLRKREKPGTKPIYLEEEFWVTLFGFFSVQNAVSQDSIVEQMTIWCEHKYGRDSDGNLLYGSSFIDDKVRLAFQQLDKAKKNRKWHPEIKEPAS